MAEDGNKLNLRAEYTSLTEKAFQFTLFRITILFTIILLMYNIVNDDKFNLIMSRYKEVQELADVSWDVPYTGDWYVDNMFDNHGLSTTDSAQYFRTIYDREISIYDAYPQADSIFEAVPPFFNYGDHLSNDDSNRMVIQGYFDLIHDNAPENRRPALDRWFADFWKEYGMERTQDSLYWVEAGSDSLRLARSIGDKKDRITALHDSLVQQHHAISKIAVAVIVSDVPFRTTLFSLLGQPNKTIMATAHKSQIADLAYIRMNIANSFGMKLPFLGDTPLNFQYWIFILPILMILSFMYLVILRSKIGIIEQHSKNLKEAQTSEGLLEGTAITEYHKQPYRTFSRIFDYVEILLWSISVYIFAYVILNFHGFVGDIIKGALIGIYFALIYCHKVVYDLRRCSLIDPKPPLLFVIRSKLALSFTHNFRYKSRQPFLIVGNSFVILTLMLTMCYGGCRRESAVNQKFTLPTGEVLTEDQLTQKVGITRSISGMELIMHFKEFIWDFGVGGRAPNRFFQICYIIIVGSMLMYLLLILMGKIFKKKLAVYRFKHVLFIVFSLLFIEYTIYYSTPFTKLNFTILVIMAMCSAWLYMNKWSLSPFSNRISYFRLGQSLLMFIFPFFVLGVIRTWPLIISLMVISPLGGNKQLVFYGLSLTISGLLIALQTERQIVPVTSRGMVLLPLLRRSIGKKFESIGTRFRKFARALGSTWKYAFFLYMIIVYVSVFVEENWRPESDFFKHPLNGLLGALVVGIMVFMFRIYYLLVFWLIITWANGRNQSPMIQRSINLATGTGLIALNSNSGTLFPKFNWYIFLSCTTVLLVWVLWRRLPQKPKERLPDDELVLNSPN
jgi:hypothetical protein